MKISHIMSTLKILTDLCLIRQGVKIKKKHVCRYCLQCFGSEKVLAEHKTNCLKIKS